MFDSENSSSILFHDTSILLQDHFLEPAFLESTAINDFVINENIKKRERIASNSSTQETNDDQPNIKKVRHRDVERQRRQEMSGLYASLRNLLPLEYIKGKRSVSDHMHEAVNYINHMERKMEELKMRRDELKSSTSMPSQNISSNSGNFKNYVRVSSCGNGVEILITIGLKGGGFPLSRVLVELLGIGLDVVSCTSGNANDGFLYRILSQDVDLTYIDLPMLQRRLANVVEIFQWSYTLSA